ncbi:MAG: hypothetical protein ABL871_14705 [Terricaulis sp.]
MTALGLVRAKRGSAPASIHTIEYLSSEHRGIIMFSEAHTATSVAGTLAYAKTQLSSMEARYGARGYRVRDADGRVYRSDTVSDDE